MKKVIKNIDRKLFFTSIILFAFGLIMIFSASNVTAYMRDASPSIYFIRESIFLLVAFAFCLFAIRISTKKYKSLSWIALIGVTGAIFVALVYSVAVNGVTGWLGIGRLGIQPSEFAKVVIIIWLSIYWSDIKDKEYKEQLPKVIFSFIVIMIIFFLVVLQNDYGTAMIFLIICASLFFLAPISKKIKKTTLLIGLGAVLLGSLVLLATNGKIISSEKLERFNFTRPCDRFLTTGNQVCNGYIAMNNGGLIGKGLGNSTQKYLYLPEAYTDFIFAIIVEELGVVGAVGLFLLYLFLLARIILCGKRATKDSHSLMCYGIAIYIFLHIVVNLGGVMGIIPLTGVPLPFMSYGGSFACCIVLALLVIQRINYEINISNNKNI